MTNDPLNPGVAPEAEPFLGTENVDVELGSYPRSHDAGSEYNTHARKESACVVKTSSSNQIWNPILSSMTRSLRRRRTGVRRSEAGRPSQEKSKRGTGARLRWTRFITIPLMFFGLVQFTSLILNFAVIFFPEHFDSKFINWRNRDEPERLTHWPTDATADILPVRCHSHNDYWRKIPVRSAIAAGCTGIEADVWLRKGDLFVGHNPASLTKERTFTSLYINPLLDILGKQNPSTEFHLSIDMPPSGVFDTDTEQSLVLLIDFKTNGYELWPVVSSQLEPLRKANYLSSFDGSKLTTRAITVVATGNAPFEKVVANTTYRDMFFDAPLRQMASLAAKPPAHDPLTYDSADELAFLSTLPSQPDTRDKKSSLEQGQGYSGHTPQSPTIYSPFNSYYASTSLKASIGVPMPYFTAAQRQTLSDQIAGAHSLGLQVRYWDTPGWPISWRNYIWRELVKTGIDCLNVDDLEGAAKGDWKSSGGFGKWVWGSGHW